MSTLAEQQGPWLPLREGMPVPPGAFDAEPLMHLCFNEFWQPAVLTALKLLTRPEAWVGTQIQVEDTVRDAHTLMGQLTLGCELPPAIPNWHLFGVINSGQIDNDAWLSPVPGLDGAGVPTLTYDMPIWELSGFPPDVTITGHANLDLSFVGGVFSDVQVRNQSDPAGQAYVLTIEDCLGGSVVHSDFTPRTYTGTFKRLRFVSGNSTVYFLKFTIKGDWVCGGA